MKKLLKVNGRYGMKLFLSEFSVFQLFFETEPFAVILIAHGTYGHSQKFLLLLLIELSILVVIFAVKI